MRITILFLFLTTAVFSQTLKQTVRGQVFETGTNTPIFGANVSILDSELGAITDENGFFRIENVPVGRASITFSYVGFETQLRSEILITSAKEISLKIYLVEALEQLGQVLIVSKNKVKAYNEVAAVSAHSFGVEETKRFPASISDPGRMALSFAGVTSSDDETNEIIIRGNAPNQLLWRIEGVEVPQPNHFSEEGYTPGAVSMLNSNMLGKSDFLTGAFPAEFGNAISGVFDIGLRNGNSDHKEYSFSLGVLGVDFTMEGPLSKNKTGSYLLNYRYSTISLLDKMIDISEGSTPVYQDMAFKINQSLGEKTNLSIWGVGGISNEDEDEEIFNGFANSEFFDSNTYMSGISINHFFNEKNKLKVGISYSGNGSDFKYNEHSVETVYNYDAIDKLKNNAFRITTDYTKKVNNKSTLKFGAIASLLNYNVKSSILTDVESTIVVDEKGNGTMFQAYAQQMYRFNDKLSGSAGLHGTYFSINEQMTVEPRLGLEWRFAPKHTLSAGYGIHSRKMPLNQYFVQVENSNNTFSVPNKELDLMSSTHYVLGYDWRIIKSGHLKLEAYYQKLNKLAIVKDPYNTNSYINGEFINAELTDTGIGENYGFELTFEKFFSNQYYFLVTSSIFDSKYKASNNIWYNSKFNYNYTFNLVGGKEFTIGKNGNKIFSINGKTLFNGGKLGTPIDMGIYNDTGIIEENQLLRNTVELDEYFRVDLSLNYIVNKPKVVHKFSLDVQNVTGRDNVYSQGFNPNSEKIETYYQLGIVPIIKYQIDF